MKGQIGIVLLVFALPMVGVDSVQAAQVATPSPVASPIGSPGVSPVAESGRVSPVTMVAQLTGAASINDTEAKYGVAGTDLGHTFAHEGQLYMVFGDTFGTFKSDWRSNV